MNLENLTELADTILYEQAVDLIKKVEQAKTNPLENIHKVNSMVYQEFWRRGKAKYYYQAHNQVMKSIGKAQHVI